MKNIVLVHGGFVDGSGWEGVQQILLVDPSQNGVLSPVLLTNHSLKKGAAFCWLPRLLTLALTDSLAREKFLVNAGGCVGKYD